MFREIDMSLRIEKSNWNLLNIGYSFISSATEITQYVLNYFESIRNWFVTTLSNPITNFFSIYTRISPETIEQYINAQITPKYNSLQGNLSHSDPKEYQEIITRASELLQSTLQANEWLYQSKSYLSSHQVYLQATTTIEKVHTLITAIVEAPLPSGIPPGCFSKKPVLIANEGNTCFINVVLQLFFTVPALFEYVIKCLPSDHYLNVKTLSLQYKVEQALEGITGIPSKRLPGSQKAREDLARQGSFSMWGEQEDGHEAFCTLFKHIHPTKEGELHPLYQTVEMKKKLEGVSPIYDQLSNASRASINEEGFFINHEVDSITSLTVCDKATTPIDFEELLINYCNEKMNDIYNVTLADGSKRSFPITESTKRYASPPAHLLYHFNRCTFDPVLKIPGKNNRPINLLPNFTLPSSLCLSEEEGNYQIEGFASHEGVSGAGGHYVAYSRTREGRWYYLNDISSGVREADEAEVTKALQSCYFFYAILKSTSKKTLENIEETPIEMDPREEEKEEEVVYTLYDQFWQCIHALENL